MRSDERRPGGTTPPGVRGEDETSRWVRGMFSRVAHRYDFLNHLLSLNFDRYWRLCTVRRIAPTLRRRGIQVMDLCCGTGDLLIALETEMKSPAIGSDFCHPMLVAARAKLERGGFRSRLVEADALHLPVPDSSLDAVTVAFGFRNLVNYEKGLQEMARVLKPSGVAAILEFSRPPNPLFGRLYDFYSKAILPRIGGAISGTRDAYQYLPESVRKFPLPEELAAQMKSAGFAEVEFERITGGIVALHVGRKS